TDADLLVRRDARAGERVLQGLRHDLAQHSVQPRPGIGGIRGETVAGAEAGEAEGLHHPTRLSCPRRDASGMVAASGRPTIAPRPREAATSCRVRNPPVGPIPDEMPTWSPRPTRIPAPSRQMSKR